MTNLESIRKTDGPALAFSQREDQVLDLLIQGKSNKEIGTRLGLSPNTVKAHLSNMMKKATVQNRTELAILGRDLRTGMTQVLLVA